MHIFVNKQLTLTGALLVPFSLLSLAGCGASGDFDTAYVEATVTCSGSPMSAGRLVLTPIRPQGLDPKEMNIGKPALGDIQSDGTIVFGTYGSSDGAVIGRHKVYLKTDELNDGEHQPCMKMEKEIVVEVREGNNYLNIDLVDGVTEQ